MNNIAPFANKGYERAQKHAQALKKQEQEYKQWKLFMFGIFVGFPLMLIIVGLAEGLL